VLIIKKRFSRSPFWEKQREKKRTEREKVTAQSATSMRKEGTACKKGKKKKNRVLVGKAKQKNGLESGDNCKAGKGENSYVNKKNE